MRRCALLLPFAVLLVAADVKEAAITKEKAALKGKWQVVAVADTTSNVPQNDINAMSWVFADDTITVVMRGKEDSMPYTIDSTKNPKEMDKDVFGTGQWSKGIYELRGDKLIICGAGLLRDRPTEFKPDKELRSSVITFKRITKATEDKIAKDKAALRGKWKAISIDLDPNESIRGERLNLSITFADVDLTFASDKETRNEYSIDPSKYPKEMDTTVVEGPQKGNYAPSVYKLEGDTLVICVSGIPNQPRPTEFKASREAKWVVVTLKRLKE